MVLIRTATEWTPINHLRYKPFFSWFWLLPIIGNACTSTPKSSHAPTNSKPSSPDTTQTDLETEPTCETPWKETILGDNITIPSQGVSSSERPQAEQIRDTLLSSPEVAMVFWKDEDTNQYHVFQANGRTSFTHHDGQWVWDSSPNLLIDPLFATTLSEELAAGSNPNQAVISGYEATDPRLSFVSTEDMSWPYLAARIAQIFDGTNAPDMGYALASYARGGTGSHGGMSMFQSRAPLFFHGPGIVSGEHEMVVQHVDIAPTVAALLGVQPTAGIHGQSRQEASNLLLKWQDGRVIDEVLDTCPYGAAEYAVIFIIDGLSHTEIWDAVQRGDTPNFSKIVNQNTASLLGGSIVGWPSFSLPGHVSIHTGTFQGHHGLYSNIFLHRATQETAPGMGLAEMLTPGNEDRAIAVMDSYLSPQVETMFEAVNRSFPTAHTVSINELTFRGVTWGPTAQRDLTQYELADSLAVFRVQQMFDEIGPAKYTAISLYLTDKSGERTGPHSDSLRESLIATDTRIGQILDMYEAANIFDKTLFVLTSDHGMALQDPTRTNSVNIQQEGTQDLMNMIYLGQ